MAKRKSRNMSPEVRHQQIRDAIKNGVSNVKEISESRHSS